MSRLKELRGYVDAELNKIEDADVIDHCLKDPSKAVKEKEQARFDKLCSEFGMQ